MEKGGKRLNSGRKAIAVEEKKLQVALAVYRKRSEIQILKDKKIKFREMKKRVCLILNSEIDSLLE